MTRISYTVVPKHGERRAASAEQSSRVIANAMRLLIAIILMSALVAIIILAAHRIVEVQPVQPWTLAPAPVPSTLEIPPSVILERKYILCNSELSNTSCELPPPRLYVSTGNRDFEDNLAQSVLKVFANCALIRVQLDVGLERQQQPNVSTSPARWFQPLGCHRNKALEESKPELVKKIPLPWVRIYNIDEKHLFHGTPFLSRWEDFFDSADDVLDSCIRLILVWRYGGIACNFEETAVRKLPAFRNLLDARTEDVVITEDTSVVYSKSSCHSAIGTMLRDYANFSLSKSEEASTAEKQINDIMISAENYFKGSVYFETVDILPMIQPVQKSHFSDRHTVNSDYESD